MSERASVDAVVGGAGEPGSPLADAHPRILDADGKRLRIGHKVNPYGAPHLGTIISFPNLEERGYGVEVLWRGERSSETFPACFPDARKAWAGDETLQCDDLVFARVQ